MTFVAYIFFSNQRTRISSINLFDWMPSLLARFRQFFLFFSSSTILMSLYGRMFIKLKGWNSEMLIIIQSINKCKAILSSCLLSTPSTIQIHPNQSDIVQHLHVFVSFFTLFPIGEMNALQKSSMINMYLLRTNNNCTLNNRTSSHSLQFTENIISDFEFFFR